MLLDTSAWIEYFKGTEKGGKVKLLLSQFDKVFYTCPLAIAEISSWCRKNGQEPFWFLGQIKKFSRLLELSEDILVSSGGFYAEIRKVNNKIGMIDCIIYTTAMVHGLKLLTKDSDFAGLDYVEML